jgi:hypothetical protein
MKMDEILPNGGIGDINVGYNTEIGRYTTFLSSMNELSEIGGKGFGGEEE